MRHGPGQLGMCVDWAGDPISFNHSQQPDTGAYV